LCALTVVFNINCVRDNVLNDMVNF
jgi:hypothetical protein